ncbi:MAG: DUF5106 domain-containing protein [Bacteroidales bacterium]
MNNWSTFIVLILLMISCKEVSNTTTQEVTSDIESKPIDSFELPSIPDLVTDPKERMNILTSRYWDNFDFTDKTILSSSDVTERIFVDFLEILQANSPENSRVAIEDLIKRAAVDSTIFIHFANLSEKYLYDLNSPFRDEELYLPVLNEMISSGYLDDVQKIRPRYTLHMIMKNRVGDKAANFIYTSPSGARGSLYGIRSQFTLLFFNNPDCEECNILKSRIKDENIFAGNEIIKVVAIYPDRDLDMWRSTDYPKEWVNGYNSALFDEHIYDLKAMPTLYLLDRDKVVLLKDASFDDVMELLVQNRVGNTIFNDK